MRIPELELLGRHYGVLLRTQYKQMLANHLNALLQPNGAVHHLAGHDLVSRLNSEEHQARTYLIDRSLRQFRFYWGGVPLRPRIGMNHCNVRSPVKYLYLLLGELDTIADMSLASGHPENMQCRGAGHVQQGLKDKVVMMDRILKAPGQDHFVLMAQSTQGIRGDNYHEVLLRVERESGKLTGPNTFLSVVHEFGLSSRMDQWVIEYTLAFMDAHRRALPGLRLAINLSPVTLSRSQFPQGVKTLLQTCNIEPWRIIFELTENYALSNPELVCQTLEHLRALGCRVAIDDFGTGYASYARLKVMNVDVLKIDGSFICSLPTSSFDYQVVDSICRLACMKNMQVMAEYVESPGIRQAVIALGIDYLQGYDIGVPVPLAQLAKGMTA